MFRGFGFVGAGTVLETTMTIPLSFSSPLTLEEVRRVISALEGRICTERLTVVLSHGRQVELTFQGGF